MTRELKNQALLLLRRSLNNLITKQGSKWYTTPISYQPDNDKIARLTQIRHAEQARMLEYMQSRECLMMFLARELDDPELVTCGKCAVCEKRLLLPQTYSIELVNEAVRFLRRSDRVIEPRKQWPKNALLTYKWNGNIQAHLRAEEGRALSLWGDAGWGEFVKLGKYRDNNFESASIEGAIAMIQRWQPQPFPTWVTAVPSLNRPELVPNFAQRLAEKLGLPFVPAISKIRQTRQQKEMSNSYQQAHNLDGAFAVNPWKGISGAVFLVDDIVDSRWTFSINVAFPDFKPPCWDSEGW